MAFLSKFGNILRQTANKQIKSELSPFKPSILQAIRCMSTGPSSKLFIGGTLLIAQISFPSRVWCFCVNRVSVFVLQVFHFRLMNRVSGKNLPNMVKFLMVCTINYASFIFV